jgi:FixJ family two-component response regulator
MFLRRRCAGIAVASGGHVVTGSKSRDDPASAAERIVFVIDDDVAVRTTLSSLVRSIGLRVELFGSAREFAQIKMPDVASCLVLDIRLPGVSGLDLQAELAEADIRIPIIFMTGHGDIPMSVKAMKAGAVDFLTKPFRDQDILDAVIRALERDQKRRDSEKTVSELRILFESLTSREREVMTHVADGLMNKQIAAKFGITEITVKVHRGHMMRKMKARSLIHLLGMADLLGIRRPKP